MNPTTYNRSVAAWFDPCSRGTQNQFSNAPADGEANMKTTKPFLGILGLLTIFALASMGISQDDVKTTKDAKEAVEVQTRGPLHEAFAQPFGVTPGPGPIVPKAPPGPVPEDPPEQKPD